MCVCGMCVVYDICVFCLCMWYICGMCVMYMCSVCVLSVISLGTEAIHGCELSYGCWEVNIGPISLFRVGKCCCLRILYMCLM